MPMSPRLMNPIPGGVVASFPALCRAIVHRRVSAGVLCAAGLAASAGAAPATGFTLEQILSAPFPSGLVAAPADSLLGWVNNTEGRRNIWLATPDASGSGYASRQLTHYTRDDGQDIGDIAFVPRRDALLYVRGGDFENPDKPAPNPAHLTAGTEQDIYRVDFKGGLPVKLAEGHAPLVSPAGDRVVFLHKGEVWTLALGPGAKPAQLFKARGEFDSLRFAPDGTQLAFVSNRGDHSFIGVYSFGVRSLRWIDASFGNDLEPRWSPDGTRIAFLRLPYTHDEVGIGPHRTGEPWSIRVATLA